MYCVHGSVQDLIAVHGSVQDLIAGTITELRFDGRCTLDSPLSYRPDYVHLYIYMYMYIHMKCSLVTRRGSGNETT